MNKTSNLSFTVNPQAAASFDDDGMVILHVGNGSLYKSNRTGAVIWRGVEQGLSVHAIAEEISIAYQVAETTAREDTLGFLAQLERNALIHKRLCHEKG